MGEFFLGVAATLIVLLVASKTVPTDISHWEKNVAVCAQKGSTASTLDGDFIICSNNHTFRRID